MCACDGLVTCPGSIFPPSDRWDKLSVGFRIRNPWQFMENEYLDGSERGMRYIF